jgi:DNA mismatch endonuclease, patch repair protein
VAKIRRTRYTPRPAHLVSRNMAAVRATGNAAESVLRLALWARGYRYRRYCQRLPGRPDLTFPRARVAVFVDGDFWHGRTFIERGRAALLKTFKTPRKEWWIRKLLRNVERDREIDYQLAALGWHAVRVWERDIKHSPQMAIQRIAGFVDAHARGKEPDSDPNECSLCQSASPTPRNQRQLSPTARRENWQRAGRARP